MLFDLIKWEDPEPTVTCFSVVLRRRSWPEILDASESALSNFLWSRIKSTENKGALSCMDASYWMIR